MSDSQKPPREIWVTKSGTDPIVKGLAYVHECAHPNTTNFIDKQSYDQLMQQALAMREALAEMSESVVNNDIPDFGQRQKAYADWLKESATQALEQFDEFIKEKS